MSSSSRNLVTKVAALCMIAFGYLALNSEVKAQEENGKKPFERPSVDEHHPVPEAGLANPISIQKAPSAKSTTPLPLPKKETYSINHVNERDTKKNESPSTLSFNIFLYIVDKFKEDNDN